jgi:hypothetical protein
MKIKIQSMYGGRVALSGSERRIETTNIHETKNNLKRVGLDTGYALLDQRGAL